MARKWGQSKVNRLRLTDEEIEVIKKHRGVKEERVLVIGDIHEPFCLKGYLEFCISVYNNYSCNRVVFIGDVIDNHYSSYHETDADGLGGTCIHVTRVNVL